MQGHDIMCDIILVHDINMDIKDIGDDIIDAGP